MKDFEDNAQGVDMPPTSDISISRESQLEAQVEALQKQVERLQLIGAIDKALIKAGARNAIAVRALINIDALKMDEMYNIEGLEQIIEGIKRSDPYLFFAGNSEIFGFTPVDGRTRERDAFAFGFAGLE